MAPNNLSVIRNGFGDQAHVRLTPAEASQIRKRLELAERLAEALTFYADEANYRARSGALGQDSEPPKASPLLAQFVLREWKA